MGELQLLKQRMPYRMPYRYHTGTYMERFCRGLKEEGKFYANKCSKCERTWLPPMIVCPWCHIRMEEWVELSDKGTVKIYTIPVMEQMSYLTGEWEETPYPIGVIQLDGVKRDGGCISHYIQEKDPEKLSIGMRVQAVFKPKGERMGNLRDILYFKTIKE